MNAFKAREQRAEVNVRHVTSAAAVQGNFKGILTVILTTLRYLKLFYKAINT